MLRKKGIAPKQWRACVGRSCPSCIGAIIPERQRLQRTALLVSDACLPVQAMVGASLLCNPRAIGLHLSYMCVVCSGCAGLWASKTSLLLTATTKKETRGHREATLHEMIPILCVLTLLL